MRPPLWAPMWRGLERAHRECILLAWSDWPVRAANDQRFDR